MTGQVLVPGVPHKSQGDPKSEVLSLHSGLLPKIPATCDKYASRWLQKKTKKKQHHHTICIVFIQMASLLQHSSVNGKRFVDWIQKCLIPTSMSDTKFNPFSTETVLLVGYWSLSLIPSFTLSYIYIKHQFLSPFYLLSGFISWLDTNWCSHVPKHVGIKWVK